MRTITFPLSPAATPPSPPSALGLARTAIARWRGGAAAARPPKEAARISTQARYLAQAQDNLKAWIAAGGFSHDPTNLGTASAQLTARTAAPACPASADCSVLAA